MLKTLNNESRFASVGLYLFAVATVAVALAVTLTLWRPVFSRNPFALFYMAVLISAWLGGIGPGLLSAAFAVATITYFITPSFVNFDGTWRDLVQAGTFVVLAIAVSTLDSRRRRAVQALQHSMSEIVKAKDEADAANAAKDRFLAVLSHELRTPLTPALAAAQAMQTRKDLPPLVREDIEMIHRNIDLEARLIDDLLDVTRITQNKLKLRPKLVDVHALIHQVLDICRVDADGRNVRTYRELNAIKPVVMADSARMNQVLWNLVKNAIKFTPAGGAVTVRTSGDDQRIRIDVSDTGIGIEPDALGRIFNAFEQAGENITREFGGLGLGLAITRALVESHGGKISATSAGTGQGSTFSIELNVAAENLPATDAPAAHPAPRIGGLRLLLVEDHKDTATMMSRLLRSLDYQVDVAHTVEGALATAAKQEFDLVISDLGLPDASGLDLMRELRQKYHLRGIALSGYGMEDDVARSHEAGFVTHLTKPVDFAVLQQTIAETAGTAPQRVSA
jgi:signal transduction histidine kinase/CheY-like chemotaxis protein